MPQEKCKHNRQPYECVDCGGKGTCEHGKRTRWCSKCTGSHTMYTCSRIRAKKKGLLFTLTKEWLENLFETTKICPIFGTPLILGGGRNNPHSPSLDRIDARLGYTINNVWIISYRANRIKNNATVEELRRIADAVDKETKIRRERRRRNTSTRDSA